MCRFTAYIGRQSKVVGQLLTHSENSLSQQSKQARESGKTGLNADGFGLAWYNHAIDSTPALFKSINPAWSDFNLRYLAAKTMSRCFLGHVRAATVGDVHLHNCHPFAYENYSFVHNGTIKHFNIIRRDVLSLLSDEVFSTIKGQTDSEHLFALIMQIINEQKCNMQQAFTLALKTIRKLQSNKSHSCLSRINTVLTDGNDMLVTRYLSDPDEKPISLYYRIESTGIIIASEPLDEQDEAWHILPLNATMLIKKDLSFAIAPLEL